MPQVTKRDVAAVVVLFNPARDVLGNIAAFAGQVDKVFAVDNTKLPENSFVSALRDFEKVDHVPLRDNLGIAAALNRGAECARKAGYRWVLTMDQDSTPAPDMVARMLACLDSTPDPSRVGLLAPEHHQVGGLPHPCEEGCRDILTTMTSGNLLSVQTYDEVGPFMEELFIDQVDTEYCLRLHRSGYRVVLVGGAVLHHRVGAVRRHRWPYPAFSSNHSPARRYYITRNRFFVARIYQQDFPQYGRFEKRQMFKEAVKILLYEASKTEKLGMMWRGYRDYRAGHMGRLEEPR